MMKGGDHMTQPVLQVRGVSKHFKKTNVLRDVNLTVQAGEICALIGENGAGKTTLMRLILGLSPMQSGTIVLLGETVGHLHQALSRVGAVIESPAAFSKLTVRQNLQVTAIQHGLNDASAITKAIHFVGLDTKAKTKAGHLSLGQKQRLGLATAIIAQPDLLILDEPINGLDPSGIVEFRTLLQQLNQDYGTTILISSHILAELYQVATQFAFLHHGTIIKALSKAQLDEANRAGLVVQVAQVAEAAQLLDAKGLHEFTVQDDHTLIVGVGQIEAADLNTLFVQHGVAVASIAMKEASLEDYYTNLLKEAQP